MGLQKAVIYDVKDEDNRANWLTCMFNPAEYTVSKSNEFKERSTKEGDAPHADLSMAGVRTLSLNLMFDTCETGEDVNKKTQRLWEFIKRRDEDSEAKKIVFKWSVFEFVAYITNISQQFTMFTPEGIPVRSKVDVSFREYLEKPKKQNPTSGGGPPERIWKVMQGDRLDLIAFKVYNDSTQWRRIAERNHLSNPLNLRPGQFLQIPKE